MNNCDKLKICARIKISPAIFITREIFADDSVYARLIPPSEAGEYLGPTVTVWTSCPSQASSNPSIRYKTLQEKWLFHRLSDRKLDAPAACKIGSEIMIHHHAVTARPRHRNKRCYAPNTECKSSVEHDSKDCQTSSNETHQDLPLQGVYILNYQTFFLDFYLTCMKHKCRYN